MCPLGFISLWLSDNFWLEKKPVGCFLGHGNLRSLESHLSLLTLLSECKQMEDFLPVTFSESPWVAELPLEWRKRDREFWEEDFWVLPSLACLTDADWLSIGNNKENSFKWGAGKCWSHFSFHRANVRCFFLFDYAGIFWIFYAWFCFFVCFGFQSNFSVYLCCIFMAYKLVYSICVYSLIEIIF